MIRLQFWLTGDAKSSLRHESRVPIPGMLISILFGG